MTGPVLPIPETFDLVPDEVRLIQRALHRLAVDSTRDVIAGAVSSTEHSEKVAEVDNLLRRFVHTPELEVYKVLARKWFTEDRSFQPCGDGRWPSDAWEAVWLEAVRIVRDDLIRESVCICGPGGACRDNGCDSECPTYECGEVDHEPGQLPYLVSRVRKRSFRLPA